MLKGGYIAMKQFFKDIFWNLPIISSAEKENIYYKLRQYLKNEKQYFSSTPDDIKKYIQQITDLPEIKNKGMYVDLTKKKNVCLSNDMTKLIAYYLPQYYPFKENDEWWGKGTTEWTNVSKAVPQYIGHNQPRLPGELGYYDLRLKENIVRQIDLAKLYGVYGFCYYYYWFDGKRLLDRPLDLLLDNKELDMPFCLCWANENWTRRFESTSGEVIMKQSSTEESYKKFIKSLGKYLTDQRYIQINNKKVLIIYQPTYIPNCQEVIKYWRGYCEKNNWGELYLIAIKVDEEENFLEEGFDAVSEFQPRNVLIDDTYRVDAGKLKFPGNHFYGNIYSYKQIVCEKKYLNRSDKMYKAVMPMWDNTARKNNKGIIFHGSTPDLYEEWLSDVIKYTKQQKDLDDNFIFLNAWNEWGEGAYLEPDRKYGYAYLQATRNALEKTRNIVEPME